MSRALKKVKMMEISMVIVRDELMERMMSRVEMMWRV